MTQLCRVGYYMSLACWTRFPLASFVLPAVRACIQVNRAGHPLGSFGPSSEPLRFGCGPRILKVMAGVRSQVVARAVTSRVCRFRLLLAAFSRRLEPPRDFQSWWRLLDFPYVLDHPRFGRAFCRWDGICAVTAGNELDCSVSKNVNVFRAGTVSRTAALATFFPFLLFYAVADHYQGSSRY